MSAQPVYEEPDPRDPQVIHDQLPAGQRPEFLREYRALLEVARDDIAKYKELKTFLARWQLIASMLNDPSYHEALEEARAAATPGLSEDEVSAMRRAG